MGLLDEYGSEDEDVVATEETTSDAFRIAQLAKKPADSNGKKAVQSVRTGAAPDVLAKDIMTTGSSSLITRPTDTQMNVNLGYQEMMLPVQGPSNPFKDQKIEKMNTLTGFVEDHVMADDDFKQQQRSFTINGYARNPNLNGIDTHSGAALPFVGNVHAAWQKNGATVAEQVITRAETKALKRKRKAKGELGVFDEEPLEGEEPTEDGPKEYQGPWADWDEEKLRPGQDGAEEEESYEARRRTKKPTSDKATREVGFGEEKSVFHGKEFRDYQGRTYMDIPRDVDVNLDPETPGEQQCFIPKKCIHTWSGHSKGVSALRVFPNSGHLILSGSMDSRIKLWDVYHEGKCLRTFFGHSQAVRDVQFTNDGKRFLSCSYDRQIKLWDTETGQCIQAFSNGKVPICMRFNPDADKQNIFLAGMADKKIVQYDMNSGEIVQEYDQHLGPVNTITFCDENRRFVTTSDDKSIRAWDFDIPVVVKYIAEPTMHSMPAVTKSPNEKWLAMQSLDNQILIYSADTFRENRKKGFRGHTTSGYACEIGFSPDGRFISSGDGAGNLHFWDFKTSRKYPNTIRAHNQVLITHAWLPHETSKVVTGSWDGLLKLWD